MIMLSTLPSVISSYLVINTFKSPFNELCDPLRKAINNMVIWLLVSCLAEKRYFCNTGDFNRDGIMMMINMIVMKTTKTKVTVIMIVIMTSIMIRLIIMIITTITMVKIMRIMIRMVMIMITIIVIIITMSNSYQSVFLFHQDLH